MPAQQQPKKKRKSHGDQRGEYKLRVYFIDHKLDSAFTMYSTKRQDRNNNVFVRSLKEKISNGDWKYKVNHAVFYQNGDPFLEYTDWTKTWDLPKKK